MAELPIPTKVRLRDLTINGWNLTRHANQLRVFETISKPYITAQLIVIDNTNLLENMQLVGGEPAHFAFDGGDRVYEQSLQVLSLKGEKSNQSLRSMIYTIDLIGNEYFKDQSSIVQRSFKGISGTAAISRIHSENFGTALRTLQSSMGPISLQSYIVSAKNPFTAINDIRKRLVYAGKSGLTMYFRDRDGHVLAPLETLFENLSSQGTFIQKATWGADWFDIVRTQNAIIAAIAEVDFNKSGRAGAQDIASAAKQEKRVFDIKRKEEVVQQLARSIAPGKVSGTVNSLTNIMSGLMQGGHGGKPNYMLMDSAHLSKETDPQVKAESEQLYNALIKNGPVITVKVPIQSGIECTVGQGVFLDLLPPVGDVNFGRNSAKGMYLVKDLMHECYFDDRLVNATTTMACARGGLDT